ncbi:hypothetical protein BY996DRAFT_6473721 [Phakopsora pachyrhizi]|nr:hypothetical protein BY996DRAFT_6473721 [Phakopsora pachyrhizi]
MPYLTIMDQIYYIQNQSTAMRIKASTSSARTKMCQANDDGGCKVEEHHGRLTTLQTGMSPTATVVLESRDRGGVGGAIAGGEGFEWGPKTSLALTGSLSVGKEGLRGSIAQWGLVLAAIRDDRLPNGHQQFCDEQLINIGSKDDTGRIGKTDKLHDKTYQAVNPKERQGKSTGRLPLTGEKISCTIEQYKPARIEPIYARRQSRRKLKEEGGKES